MTVGVIAAFTIAALAGAASAPIGVPASVIDYPGAQAVTLSYPTWDGGGERIANTQWRVVDRTGNCCENYLASDASGTIYDFGGTYLRLTSDAGQTWKEVRPLGRLVNGEGAITAAPNGDIVGMTWDPYSGDHIVTFKYDNASEGWFYAEQVFHRPFYDRPWLSVVDGPFTIGAVEVPYITILMSNFFTDGFYYSLDGLNYTLFSSASLDRRVGETVSKWLTAKNDPMADYFQPHTESMITPINGGGAVSARSDLFSLGQPTAIMQPPDIKWSAFEFPQNAPEPGRMIMDSKAQLHHVATRAGEASFRYSVSNDGGKSWSRAAIDLPADTTVEDLDFKAHGGAGISAISIHAHNNATNVDVDLVYKFRVRKAKPKLIRLYQLGLANQSVSSGLGADLRFDFATVAILPSGQITASFIDGSHPDPAAAIQLSDY